MELDENPSKNRKKSTRIVRGDARVYVRIGRDVCAISFNLAEDPMWWSRVSRGFRGLLLEMWREGERRKVFRSSPLRGENRFRYIGLFSIDFRSFFVDDSIPHRASN